MLALITDAFGGYGGIAQYNRDFLAACASSSALASVIALPRIAPLELEDIPPNVTQLRSVMSRLLYAAGSLLQAIRSRPRVIFNGHILHGPLALFLARLTRAKLISQLHGTEVWEHIPASSLAALERSDLIFAVSRDTRNRAIAKLRIDPERITVVSNTVDERYSPGDRALARLKFELGDERVILTVARLDGRNGYKGHDRIIQLLPALLEAGTEVTYLVAGTGPDRSRLEQLASELGVRRHVRFLGMVPIKDLPDLYRAADLFALPSTGEGFGIAFLEAMACGTPAIGLSVGGAPDALGDGELGRCVAPEEFPEELFQALEQSIERDQGLPQRVRKRFGFDGFANRLDLLLGELLAPSSARDLTAKR